MPAAPAVLVVGTEEFLVDRAVAEQIPGGPDRGDPSVIRLATADLDRYQLVEALSPTLFGATRAVVVSDVHDADRDLQEALVALVAAADRAALVMTHSGSKAKPLIDRLREAGARVVTVEPPRSGRDREQFLIDEAARLGGSIDREAATELLAAVGPDLRELSTVCAQLVADTGPRVSAEAVATYHRGRAELSGFAVADRAVEGSLAAAVEAARWALAGGVSPVLITAALAANLRLIGQVAGSRGTPETLAPRLKQPAWKVRRAQGWVRRWRPEALAAAVAAVATADAEVKGAADDAAYAVERAVTAVASAAAG